MQLLVRYEENSTEGAGRSAIVLARVLQVSNSSLYFLLPALLFPVVVTIIRKENLNPLAALYVLMIGASASYSTPIGYQVILCLVIER
jgi:di/tricarboxylate transporter